MTRKINFVSMSPLGIALKKARIDIGVRQKQMAEAFDVTPAFLSAVESGVKKYHMIFYTK